MKTFLQLEKELNNIKTLGGTQSTWSSGLNNGELYEALVNMPVCDCISALEKIETRKNMKKVDDLIEKYL